MLRLAAQRTRRLPLSTFELGTTDSNHPRFLLADFLAGAGAAAFNAANSASIALACCRPAISSSS
jgi:hypothetical protein